VFPRHRGCLFIRGNFHLPVDKILHYLKGVILLDRRHFEPHDDMDYDVDYASYVTGVVVLKLNIEPLLKVCVKDYG